MTSPRHLFAPPIRSAPLPLGSGCRAATRAPRRPDAARAFLLAVACLGLGACSRPVEVMDQSLSDESVGPVGCVAPTPGSCQLSELGRAVYDAAYCATRQGSDGTPINSTVPRDAILSSENVASAAVLNDGDEIFPTLRDLVANARHEVAIEMFDWELGSDASNEIFRGLHDLSRRNNFGRPPVHARILINALGGVPEGAASLLAAHGYDVRTPEQIAKETYFALMAADLKTLEGQGSRLIIDENEGSLSLTIGTRAFAGLGVMHQKLVVIDGQVVHIGGANVQRFHNWKADQVPWHDSAYVLCGEVGRSMLADFDRMWAEGRSWGCHAVGDGEFAIELECSSDDNELPFRSYEPPGIDACPRRAAYQDLEWLGDGCLPTIALVKRPASITQHGGYLGTGDVDHPAAAGYIAAIAAATHHIHLETPNLNDDLVVEALANAVQRGVEVQIVTGLGFNDPAVSLEGQGGTNAENVGRLWKAVYARGVAPASACANLAVRFHAGRHDGALVDARSDGHGIAPTHTKYLSIDDRLVIVGSTNMDTQSWNFSGEANVAVDSAEVAAAWEATLFLPDWDRGIPTWSAGADEAGTRSYDLACGPEAASPTPE